MNERVVKLIERSMEPTGVEGIGGSYMQLNPEKLVELVVQECIELNRQDLSFNAFERMLNRYLEHFNMQR